MKLLFKTVDRSADVGAGVAAAILVAMSVSIIWEIVGRTFLDMPTKWVVEYNQYALVAATFLGAAYVAKLNTHICVDFLTSRLSKRTRMAVELVTYAWSVAFSVFFLYLAIEMVVNSQFTGILAPTILRTSLWIPQAIVPIGFALLVLQFVKQLVNRAVSMPQIKQGTEPTKTFLTAVDRPYLIIPIFVGLLTLGAILFNLGGSLRIIGFLVVLFTILATGTPVFLSLAMVGSITLFTVVGGDLALQMQLPSIGFSSVNSFVLGALPLFIFAGGLFALSGMTGRLFDFCNSWLSFLPGNLAMATIVSCAVFAAMSGSSVATAATIGIIAIPAMIERGYDKGLACGAVAAAGTLGSMIPPSNQFIIFGAITDTSVGQLFIGGVFPGLFIAVLFMLYIYFRCRKDPRYKPQVKFTWSDRLATTKAALPVLIAPLLILGGIYGGLCTPTEAAAIAVLYGLMICLIARKINRSTGVTVLSTAASTSAMILMIIVGAMILGIGITILQIAQQFTQFAVTSPLPHWGIVVLVMLLALVLGTMMDGIALTLIVVPISFAAIMAMGYSAVWFGVLFCLVMEIGLVTPPVGMTVYTVAGISGVKMETIVRGVIPFFCVMMLCLVVVGVFEPMSTWLPSTMIR